MTYNRIRPLAVLGGTAVLALAMAVPTDAFWGHRRTVVSTGYALPSVPAVVTTAPAPVVVGRPMFGAPRVIAPSPGIVPSVATPLPHALTPASPAVTTYYAPPATYPPPATQPLPAGYAPPIAIPSTVAVPPTVTTPSPIVAPATSLPAVAAPRPTIVVPGGGMMLRRPILVVP